MRAVPTLGAAVVGSTGLSLRARPAGPGVTGGWPGELAGIRRHARPLLLAPWMRLLLPWLLLAPWMRLLPWLLLAPWMRLLPWLLLVPWMRLLPWLLLVPWMPPLPLLLQLLLLGLRRRH